MNLERRNPSFAASKSLTRLATPKKRTFFPCLHAARARPMAIWVLVHPLQCPPRNQISGEWCHSAERLSPLGEVALRGQDHCGLSTPDSQGAALHLARSACPDKSAGRASHVQRPALGSSQESSSSHPAWRLCDADAGN